MALINLHICPPVSDITHVFLYKKCAIISSHDLTTPSPHLALVQGGAKEIYIYIYINLVMENGIK